MQARLTDMQNIKKNIYRDQEIFSCIDLWDSAYQKL